MKRTLIALLATIAMSSTQAMTDYKCMQDCTDAGYGYGYCKSRCSY